MKRASSPSMVLLVGLLVLLVAGQGMAASFVLCIGENGSIAIEPSLAGKCASTESPSCAAEELAPHDHCGPCQDLSTSLDVAHGRSQGDYDLSSPAPLPALFAIAAPGFFQGQTPALLAQPPPRPYHALAALRTTVLLI